MRILHILDHSLPVLAGYSLRTQALMAAQQRHGWAVRGLTGRRHHAPGPDPEQAESLWFYRTKPGSCDWPLLREVLDIHALQRRIAAVVDEWRPDILHAHSPCLNAIAALRVARQFNLPLVYEIRAFWEDAAVANGQDQEGSIRYRAVRAAEFWAATRADAVITICAGLKDDLVARGMDASRITIVPNALDMAAHGAPRERDSRLADQLGIGQAKVVGFIGSFYAYEGLDDLIAAMPGLVAAQPDACLLLVGQGPEEARLKAMAGASPVAAHIRFAGSVRPDQIAAYYSLVDVFAYPRKKMRLTDLVTPLKPLEAMAQKRLVAASDVGGHRELVSPGENGTLFAPEDPAALAAVLADLLRDDPHYAHRRAAAREHVEKLHDWDLNVRRYEAVYHRLGKQALNRP